MVQDHSNPLGIHGFQETFPVSRETIEKFEIYLNFLTRWNGSINLVSKRSLSDPWRRHILDCAQLSPLLPANSNCIIDLGSGSGLPGLILAILHPTKTVHLVESDQRKAVFLQEAARVTKCKIRLHVERVEAVINKIPDIDVITARALGSLESIMKMVEPVLNERKLCIFPKSKGINKELESLPGRWIISSRIEPSLSDPRGQILVMEARNSDPVPDQQNR
ncbi:MAG: 16S rRNA (guanine(527)-N(7))-methyltransferase RsmG [Alphaproteobacteria bacterium]|jgi:16S rRNA (guanine527-N7)-methyltransferase